MLSDVAVTLNVKVLDWTPQSTYKIDIFNLPLLILRCGNSWLNVGQIWMWWLEEQVKSIMGAVLLFGGHISSVL